MPAFSLLYAPAFLTEHLQGIQNAPLPLLRFLGGSRSFGIKLEPRYIVRAYFPNLTVSCYALFKGWLPLSQPPVCLRKYTTFNTKLELGDLS